MTYSEPTESKIVPYLIGTDEAGYGPNLGPLTIGGTLWCVPDLNTSLYDSLADIVSAKPTREKIMIADSKAVYSSGGSIKRLETSVLSVLFALHGQIPTTWEQLQDSLNVIQSDLDEPWLQANDLALPRAADLNEVETMGVALAKRLADTGIQLCNGSCRVIFPKRFNEGVHELGNKATLLTTETLGLVRDLKFQASPPEPLNVVCDKHGGRARYAEVINELLTDEFVWTGEEGRGQSLYRWSENGQKVEMAFVSKGESFLPVAVASMFAKYVREVFMEIWNSFWQMKIPGLKPTKGYPQDAKRFKKCITEMQLALGINDETIWRNR